MESENQIAILDYIFNQVNQPNQPKIVWFSGEGEDEKINFLIRLNDFFKPKFVENTNDSSFLLSFRNHVETKNSTPLTQANFANIANKLLAVLFGSLQWKQLNKPTGNWFLVILFLALLWLRQCWLKLQLTKISKFVNQKGILSFIKQQWPILTTLVTVGTTLGTPVFSLTIAQQDGIKQNAGNDVFIFLIIFSVFSISLGLVSSLIFLVSSLFSIRQKKTLDALDKVLSKFIDKYFFLDEKEIKKQLKYQFKNNGVCFFYGFDFDQAEFLEQSMNLMLLLKQTNCFILVGCKESEMTLIKNKIEPNINLKQNSFYLDLSNEISQVEQISKFNLLFRQLRLSSELFYLEDFFDYLTTAKQIVNFLFKTKPNLDQFQENQKKLFDFLALWALVIGTDFEFNNVLWSFNNHFVIDNSFKQEYDKPNITAFFNRSLQFFQENSLVLKPELFSLQKYTKDVYGLNVINQLNLNKHPMLIPLTWDKKQKFISFIESCVQKYSQVKKDNQVFSLTVGKRVFFLLLINKQFKQIKLETALKYLGFKTSLGAMDSTTES